MGRKSLEEKGTVSYDILYDGYVRRNLSMDAHSKELGISIGAYRKWLIHFGFKPRPRGSRRARNAAPAPVTGTIAPISGGEANERRKENGSTEG